MTVNDPALYTSSTVALRPDDGTLAWYFQHVPGETLDLDEVFERVLVDVDGRQVVFSAGKHGILWKNDRATGESSATRRPSSRNVFDHIDPETGAVTYRQDIIDAELEQLVPACPSTAGGKNWHPMSYHPGSGFARPPAGADLHGDGGTRSGTGGRVGWRRHESASLLRDAQHAGATR